MILSTVVNHQRLSQYSTKPKVIALLVIGFLLICSTNEIQADDRGAKVSIGSFITLRTIDLGITEYGLGSGQLKEVNPIFARVTVKGPVKSGLVNGLGTAGVSYIMWRLKDQPKWIRYPAYIGINGFSTWVVIHNSRELRK